MAGIRTGMRNVSKIMRAILEESLRHPLTPSTLVIRPQNADGLSVEVLMPAQHRMITHGRGPEEEPQP
jgi:hypothetical protein